MMKNFNIFEVHWKIQFLGGGGGGSQKNNIEEGGLPKRGAWTVWRFKRGLARKRGGVFKGGWYPNAHYTLTPLGFLGTMTLCLESNALFI